MGDLKPLRQTHLRLRLDHYRYNVALMRQIIGPKVGLMAVVKADAYGHGLLPFAKAALEGGADCLGVAIVEEGLQLREAGFSCPVHVFGGLNAAGFEAAARAGLIVPVFTVAGARQAQRAAIAAQRELSVQIKLDTGMGRIGLRDQAQLRAVLEALSGCSELRLIGAFTHFADADNPDPANVDEQLRRFAALSVLLPTDLTRHAAASAAALTRPDTRFDMVRCGIALYGYPPVPDVRGFKPCLEWRAEITHVKDIEAGESVSYGCSYRAPAQVRVATLAVGYGDGYPRALSGKGQVLIGGKLCPILGRVCMDQIMVDVSAVPSCKPGDQAVLIGQQDGHSIDAEQLARLCGTISYEILLSPKARVPRVYCDGGEETDAEQSKV